MIATEIQELLTVEPETLSQMLNACGWDELTEFDDGQVAILMGMKAIVEEHECNYGEAYFRNIASTTELSDEQFDDIGKAITEAGGLPNEYRDRFEEICQQVKSGVSPAEAIKPPQPVVEDTPPVVGAEAEADPESAQMDRFIDEQAKAAIATTVSQIKGFADLAYEEQERLKTLFMTKYRQGLAKELLSEEFKAEFMARMTASLEGKGQEKKPTELTGVQNPTPLLSSSN